MKNFLKFLAFSLFLPLFSSPDLLLIDKNERPKGKTLEVFQELNIDTNKPAWDYLGLIYQQDRNYYRKGGKSDCPLTLELAQKVIHCLKNINTQIHETPKEKITADVIICSGESWSLQKRLHSLQKFLDNGYTCKNIFFLSGSKELEIHAKNEVAKNQKLFEGINTHHLIIPKCEDTYEDFIKEVSKEISSSFYLISCPEHTYNIDESFAHFAPRYNLNYLGVFCEPITTNFEEYIELDLKNYNYQEYLPNKEAQWIAYAYSALNILSHQVIREINMLRENKAS